MKDLVSKLLKESNKIASEYEMKVHVSFHDDEENGPSSMLVAYSKDHYSPLVFRCQGEEYEDDLKVFLEEVVENPDEFRRRLERRIKEPMFNRAAREN
jgi:hypothetical protein